MDAIAGNASLFGMQNAYRWLEEEAQMDDDDLRCERCGLQVKAIVYHGVDLYGNRVLRPILVQSDDGLFVAVRCPVHGETFHRVSMIGEAEHHAVSQTERDTLSPHTLSPARQQPA
jgi:hypothetical protein